MGRGWKRFEALVTKSLNCIKETVGRNMDIKSDSGAVSEIRNILLEIGGKTAGIRLEVEGPGRGYFRRVN